MCTLAGSQTDEFLSFFSPTRAREKERYTNHSFCASRREHLTRKVYQNMIRRHIIFYGSVQGVGFRYRARHAAELHGCTGWVRNEWDGSVTMEIQGTAEQIDAVILAIERGTYVRIENLDSRTIPVLENERGFHT